MLEIGSCFSGIGGLELGLERAGVGRVVWQVEIDPAANAVLAAQWPNVARHPDIRTFQPKRRSARLVCGGFPCQDVSKAGAGAGLSGARSGLWGELARTVRVVGCDFLLVENVDMLLARGMGTVLGDLATLGFDAEWDCLPAAAVGAPHRRDRVFILANANGGGHLHGQAGQQPAETGVDAQRQPVAGGPDVAHADRERELQSEGGLGHFGGRAGHGRQALPHANGQRLEIREGFGPDARPQLEAALRANRGPGGPWESDTGVLRVAHGIPHRVDRIRCLGNSVVPQVAEFIGRRLMHKFPEAFASDEPDDGRSYSGKGGSGLRRLD